jgi:hypothetical protein
MGMKIENLVGGNPFDNPGQDVWIRGVHVKHSVQQ